MTTFVIRDATLADMPVLADLFRRSSLTNDRDRANLLAHPEVLELPDAAVTEGRTRAATSANVIVGFASWLGSGTVLELEDLFVDPDWMRQGIGRALVRDLVEMARRRGTRRIEVTANPDALAFYQSVGFVAAGEAHTEFGPAPRMRLAVG
jgi:GNAT superfamily N-acetyltransferase